MSAGIPRIVHKAPEPAAAAKSSCVFAGPRPSLPAGRLPHRGAPPRSPQELSSAAPERADARRSGHRASCAFARVHMADPMLSQPAHYVQALSVQTEPQPWSTAPGADRVASAPPPDSAPAVTSPTPGATAKSPLVSPPAAPPSARDPAAAEPSAALDRPVPTRRQVARWRLNPGALRVLEAAVQRTPVPSVSEKDMLALDLHVR